MSMVPPDTTATILAPTEGYSGERRLTTHPGLREPTGDDLLIGVSSSKLEKKVFRRIPRGAPSRTPFAAQGGAIEVE
jgi:hypothetical protein